MSEAPSKDGSDKQGGGTVHQTILTNVEPPQLEGVSTKHFVTFMRKRDLYEKQVSEKNREPGTSVTPMSLRACIDDSYLRMFLVPKWIEADSIAKITEQQLRDCVRKRACFEAEGADLARIDRIVSHVKMDMSLPEAEDRVWTLHCKYTKALEEAGIADLPDKRPHICIAHIMRRVKPRRLKEKMKQIIRWRKIEHFDRKDFGAFMRELVVQAKKIEEEDHLDRKRRAESDEEHSGDSSSEDASTANSRWKGDRKKGKGRRGGKSKNGGKNQNDTPTSSDDALKQGANKRKRDLPPCLNKRCSGHHYLVNCPISTDQEKQTLRDEYREKKRAKLNNEQKSRGRVNLLAAAEVDAHSALFSASFAKGAIESTVLADNGSDTNLMPPAVFKQLQEACPTLTVITLEPAHCFNPIGSGPQITCKKKAKADTQLRIRHGTKLMLRDVEWLIPEEETECTILGRPVLQAIGCDNRALLSAACDKHSGVINVPEALRKYQEDPSNKHNGTVAAMFSMQSGVHHSEGGLDGHDMLDDSDIYIDLGEDDPNELSAALAEAIRKAKTNGLSTAGAERLESLFEKYRSIFG